MSGSLPDDDAVIEAALPDREIASLRDIQYLYGSLAILAEGASGEYAAYLTPSAADGLTDDDNDDNVIAVRVDCSGEDPEYEGIHLRSYSDDLRPKVAHSEYAAAARGVDHSVTHLSGAGNEPEKLAGYATDRLTRWATEDAVVGISESHDDGDVLAALRALGEDESATSAIEADVEAAIADDRQALLTVQVRTEPDGEWLWPGDLDVFGAAMVALKTERMSTKGEATDARGEGVDMVTGEETEVVGTADDPLSFYLTKQEGAFENLNPDASWRNHPVSPETALRLMKAGPYLERCSSWRYRATAYTLPYFGEMTVRRARLLHEVFDELGGDDDKTPLQVVYNRASEVGLADDLRFAVVIVVTSPTAPPSLMGYSMNDAGFVPADLAAAHESVLSSPLFAGDAPQFDWVADENDDGFPTHPLAYPWHERSSAVMSERLFDDIAGGRYFLRTFADREATDDAAPTDTPVRAFLASFGGDPLPVSELLSEYVERLLDDEDPGSHFPRRSVTQQFAQYIALAECGLLTGDSDLASASTMTETLTDPDPDASTTERREHALSEFLDGHEPLQDPERRAVFLLGAMVGHVDRYQRTVENVNQTVLSMHPIKAITKAKLKRVFTDVMDRNVVYSQRSDYVNGGLLYNEVASRLPEHFETADPQTWDISLDDLRFHYALGVTYAQGDGRTADN